ncbi:precorrin 6A synthase [Dermatophilus congolensis]|uniref:Precorrin 6A synthase n=1 Tax=Dermatophilus congolensis TaxID=1863 RepID=A0AA46BLL3_9MICO|nr:precorrin-6A synthase (deacetylating) [Dermatophilus congolensis]STD04581.1 precorrin 6A synthase [Dermatophilus congolensis]
MFRIHVIGVGVGDPAYVTMQAVTAIRDTDVFFEIDKGETKADLNAARQAILDTYADPNSYRIHSIPEAPRHRGEMPPEVYAAEVKRWRDARMDRIAEAFKETLTEERIGAFLVWGDPSLYDGTLRILDDLIARGLEIEYDVIPGISSLHALTARHGTLLNRVAGCVTITTGRRLAQEWPPNCDDVFVMLDAGFAGEKYTGQNIYVYWGAYLGSEDELLIHGPLDDVAEKIVTTRTQARHEKGWIMDSYLLRRGTLL